MQSDSTCPLCGSRARSSLPISRRLKIVRCRGCGLVRRDVDLTPSEVTALYTSDAYFRLGERGGIGYADYYADEHVYRSYFRRKLRRLRSVLPRGLLIEVGAAAGYALVEAKRAGWTVEGIEMSPDAAGRAVERFGLPVRTGTFESLSAAGVADVVAAFQTIEHVKDIHAAVRCMREALRPGGVLILTTPDHDSLQRRVMGRFWPSYRPEHLVYFDQRTARGLLSEEGFTVRSVRGDDPLLVPISRMFERAAHYWGWIHLDPGRLFGLRVPVWLGDMEIVAERT